MSVTGTADQLDFARRLLLLGEDPGRTESAPDGDLVASVPLEHVSVKNIVDALRGEDGVARLFLDERHSTVLLRGTPAAVQAALETIRGLDKP